MIISSLTIFFRQPLAQLAVFLCVFCVLVPGCTKDTGGGVPVSADFTIQLRIPGNGDSKEVRSAAVAAESSIDPQQLYLLLFREQAGKFEYAAFYTPATVTAGTVDGATVYSLSLRFPVPDPRDSYRFMVLANLTDDEFAGAAGPDGSNFKAANGTADPMETIRTGITYAQPGNWPLRPFRSFPMWGESGVFTGTSHTVGSVSMVRSVARIDVGVNFQRNPDGSYPLDNMVSQGIDGLKFRVTSVKLYNVPEKGVIGPAAANYSESGRYVTAPTLPGNPSIPPAPAYTRCVYTLGDLDYPSGSTQKRSLTRTLYVPEAANHGISDNGRAVCLVVGGEYNGSSTTYYRIDLYDRTPDAAGNISKPTAATRIDLLRNHIYVVDIISVKMKGYSTPEEAFASDPVYMDATVEVWDQSRQVNVSPDGVYNLSLNASQFFFSGFSTSGSEQTLRITTDYDGSLGRGWTLTPDEVAKESVYFLRSDGTHCHYGDPAWPSSGAPGTYSFQVGMEDFPVTPENFRRTAVLTVRAGRISRQVTLNQKLKVTGRITFEGMGDDAKLVLTDDPTDAGLFFKLSYVIGITNDYDGHQQPLPWPGPPLLGHVFYEEDIAFNPSKITPTFWDNFHLPVGYPGFASPTLGLIQQSGFGDPCRLVGYTAREIRELPVDAPRSRYDNGMWRQPTAAENAAFFASHSAPTVKEGVTGFYFSPGDTSGTFLPATGMRDMSGHVSLPPNARYPSYYYLSSNEIVMKSSDSNPDNVTVELIPTSPDANGVSCGRPIRCVRQLPDDPPPGT